MVELLRNHRRRAVAIPSSGEGYLSHWWLYERARHLARLTLFCTVCAFSCMDYSPE